MIVLGFVFVAFAFLGIYSGFTNTDPRSELTAAFTGKPVSGGGSGGNGNGNGGGNQPVQTSENGGGGAGMKLTGKMKLIPSGYCAGGIPKYIDGATIPEVERLCSRFHVKVSSGYRAGAGTTHRNGGAADFVGPTQNMRALYEYAVTAGYAWVEPWHDSNTIGVHGTTGAHVHISFALPAGMNVGRSGS